MRTAVVLGLIGLASAVSISVQTPPNTSCDPVNRDCSCADMSYGQCIDPVPSVSVHTNNLDECILNCDLFHSFDQCDWMIFYNSGRDENCLLFAPPPVETMEKFLGSCNVKGQPLRNEEDTCMTDSALICNNAACSANTPCTACEDTDPCFVNYHEAQCSMTAVGKPFPMDNIGYDGCQATCLIQSLSEAYTYFTWDRIAEVCDCFNGGERTCAVQVVKYGFTMDDINKCKSGIVSGECTSDADCAGALLCDLTGFPVCATGCRKHLDCQNDEYCTCKDCPDPGPLGQCMTGCRDLGSVCPMPGGGSGTCNQLHICTTAGTPKLSAIEMKTTTCTGCNSRAAEGAILTITLRNSPEISCVTNVLDNLGEPDYTDGDVANFSEDPLGGCKLIDSYGASLVEVSWEGAGSWTPEYITFRWAPGTLTYTCKNVNNLEVSAADSFISIPCDTA